MHDVDAKAEESTGRVSIAAERLHLLSATDEISMLNREFGSGVASASDIDHVPIEYARFAGMPADVFRLIDGAR